MLINVSPAKTGAICAKEPMSMIFDNPIPAAIPISEDVVKSDTALPAMSAMLFCFANFILICARVAAAIRKHTFLPMLAVDASKRNKCGNLSVIISVSIARLRVNIAKKRHFLMSSSKKPP